MNSFLVLSTLAIASPLFAQSPCPDARSQGNGQRSSHCEIREYTVADTGRLSIDSGMNGGIKVVGADRANVLVRARVQTSAPTDGEAKSISDQIRVQAAPGSVHADGPRTTGSGGWGVSYVVFVPRRSGLTLKAHNGGVSISDVEGEMYFETVNGGIALERAGGNVRGKTVNGGVRVTLQGATWRGNQLDLATTNGGIKVAVPEGYSARFETGTTNGSVRSELSGTAGDRSRKERRMSLTLGSGGPLVRLMTTNGGIRIGKA